MIRSARNNKIATVLIGAVLAGALAPAASANQAGDTPAEPPIYVNPSTGYPSSLPTPEDEIQVNPSTGYASVAKDEPQPAVAEPQSPSGFDWPSAAIGAAAGTALLLTLLAATVGIGSRGQGSPLRRRAART